MEPTTAELRERLDAQYALLAHLTESLRTALNERTPDPRFLDETGREIKIHGQIISDLAYEAKKIRTI